MVLLADASADDVPVVIERIEQELALATESQGLTFSTGVVEREPCSDVDLAMLVDAADRQMYQQKVLRRLRQDG